ncbi:hypothetical protein TRIATDRAFT_296989 [Trichoderma atroviride IMI 206040]|uniref:Uncharacterized protein n=1 Tax=Hypocrea atroviridis (strain ATCC 20476 / IMI 206040) TaxID=452589 RepID=G9NF76_HYPAI|nr:uncharacterized protein TRIATDRAFT_296989 [Trichoderma atroviride IMI 206040]EHK50592.1 hypothetical protein TRIATDRAFT_296989 [Trichoderma atroviride IMI 206040]
MEILQTIPYCYHAVHPQKANGVSHEFHLLPSGLVVLNCKQFADIDAKSIKDAHLRIFVSDWHLNLNLHAVVDDLGEVELSANTVGITKRSVG